jgi:hypothetical protein
MRRVTQKFLTTSTITRSLLIAFLGILTFVLPKNAFAYQSQSQCEEFEGPGGCELCDGAWRKNGFCCLVAGPSQMILCYRSDGQEEQCDIAAGACDQFIARENVQLNSCVDLGDQRYHQPTVNVCHIGSLEPERSGCCSLAPSQPAPSTNYLSVTCVTALLLLGAVRRPRRQSSRRAPPSS